MHKATFHIQEVYIPFAHIMTRYLMHLSVNK